MLSCNCDHWLSNKKCIISAEAPSSCGGYFNGSSGMIESPNYPSNYDNNAYCEYVIHVDEGMVVQLAMVEFDVEKHDNCSYDNVTVSGSIMHLYISLQFI